MELKQTLTENELLTIIGALHVNVQLANQNIQMLLQENKNLKNKISELGIQSKER